MILTGFATRGKRMTRQIRRAAACAALVMLVFAVTAEAAGRPSLRSSGFTYLGSPEFGQYTFDASIANMTSGNVLICISNACRSFGATRRISATEGVFGQRWRRGQARTVLIAACNRAGCMRPIKTRMAML